MTLRHDLIRENEAESLLRHGTRRHAAPRRTRGSKAPVEVRGVLELAYAEIHRRTPDGRAAVWRPGIVARTLASIIAAIATLILTLTFSTMLGAAVIYAAARAFGH